MSYPAFGLQGNQSEAPGDLSMSCRAPPGLRRRSYRMSTRSRCLDGWYTDNHHTQAVDVSGYQPTQALQQQPPPQQHHVVAVLRNPCAFNTAQPLFMSPEDPDNKELAKHLPQLPAELRDEPAVRDAFLKSLDEAAHDLAQSHGLDFSPAMSVVYEPRSLYHDGSYPPVGEGHFGAADQSPADDGNLDLSSLTGAESYNPTAITEASMIATPPEIHGSLPPEPSPPTPPESSSPGRMKNVIKPDREVTKDNQGKFCCTWAGCTEEVKTFSRKCEWSKHMDKHDRPYRCHAEGCEKLPGFTYSGGLLRHEREVHNKHGGPKNPLNCPHVNCKRHSGKGFSRQENLNEHLRRVHTTAGGAPAPAGEDLDDGTNELMGGGGGTKRKRPEVEEEDLDLREEIKRVRQENEELRRQVDNQTRQSMTMMQQITQLQEALNTRLPMASALAPAAPML